MATGNNEAVKLQNEGIEDVDDSKMVDMDLSRS